MWFPGAAFRRQAKEWSVTLLEMVDRPYGFVKEQMVRFLIYFRSVANPTIRQVTGTAQVSFSSTLLEGKRLSAEEEFDIKWSAASLYSGMSTIINFLCI